MSDDHVHPRAVQLERQAALDVAEALRVVRAYSKALEAMRRALLAAVDVAPSHAEADGMRARLSVDFWQAGGGDVLGILGDFPAGQHHELRQLVTAATESADAAHKARGTSVREARTRDDAEGREEVAVYGRYFVEGDTDENR